MNDQATPIPESALDDERFMRLALALGRRNLGHTWPNPTVGAVIVKDGVILGRGWTQRGGRPHAEVEALRRAKKAAQGATIYVTLEPCSHQGKAPPCADTNACVPRASLWISVPEQRKRGERMLGTSPVSPKGGRT
jgi:pyrimidine deaminase RibD-like protein